MNILFVHQNFPAQFKFLAPTLVDAGHNVVALTLKKFDANEWEGVSIVNYQIKRTSSKTIHPWITDIETKTIRGEACFDKAVELSGEGFSPDIILGHHSWGETMFLKYVWPDAKMGLYCEFYYHATGYDVGFDPEFEGQEEKNKCRMKIKNVNNHLHLDIADSAISPTQWQADSFPAEFRKKISVVHDGIDTQVLVPDPSAIFVVDAKISLSKNDEVITFVNRGLEPYRGFHIFMRALPEILNRNRNAEIVIVGADTHAYGKAPEGGTSWREVLTKEVQPLINSKDWERVHFVGTLPYDRFLALLCVSSVHVYLTYPFILSWSLLEAMSLGSAIVASDTGPLEGIVVNDQTGRLVDFFDKDALAEQVSNLLADENLQAKLGKNARKFVVENFDLKTVCLPRQIEWVYDLAGRGDS